MSKCQVCSSELKSNHVLELNDISPMKNGSKIIEPACSVCGTLIKFNDVEKNIEQTQKVVIVSGTAGAGKTALGQFIENNYDYIFIDGDAVSKKVNYKARIDPTVKNDEYLCHTETINTMLITLGLGYNVAIGYVFDLPDIQKYKEILAQYGIVPFVRVLVPTRSICIQRDLERACWTAGEEFVDKWFLSQQSFRDTHSDICIDNSYETVEETIRFHFEPFL